MLDYAPLSSVSSHGSLEGLSNQVRVALRFTRLCSRFSLNSSGSASVNGKKVPVDRGTAAVTSFRTELHMFRLVLLHSGVLDDFRDGQVYAD